MSDQGEQYILAMHRLLDGAGAPGGNQTVMDRIRSIVAENVDLRAQLATERTSRIVAEGREERLRRALQVIGVIVSLGHHSDIECGCIVCRVQRITNEALATPANGAIEVT